MFHVYVGFRRNEQMLPFKMVIEGCPRGGIAAVDFRRGHNLPEDASNRIELPGLVFVDEEFVRQHIDRHMDDADWELEYCYQYAWHCNVLGQIYEDRTGKNLAGNSGYFLTACPRAIRDYVNDPCPETAKALIGDILAYPERSKQRAEQEAAAIQQQEAEKQQRKQEARDLLKDELEGYQKKIERLQNQVTYLEKELAVKQEEEEESSL